jgi:hypothetical protein
LDELASLQKLPQLHTAVTENRKSNNPVVLGFQGRSQLETRYGHEAEAMLSQPATKIFLRTSEPRAAKWISDAIGEVEIERLRESRTTGRYPQGRNSKSYNLERQVEPLVMASEITGLQPLHGYRAIRNGQPNKLRELKKATEQANRLADVGFHLVYSFVFVAIDTREQNVGKKISFAGLPVELKQFVYFAVTTQGLNPRIGLYRTEYVQTMDDEPLITGSFYGHLVRNAEPVQQADNLTAWVSQVMLRETATEPAANYRAAGAPIR